MYVKQAGNVIELLEFFAQRRRPATPAEVADGLGWPRSSTFNLITTLVSKGYLYEPRARGGYYPSLLWQQVASAISEAEPLPEVAEALAQEVASKTGETTCIAAPAGMSALLVYAVESRQPIRFSPWLGERNPIHASGSGRAILSMYGKEERERIYRKIQFERFTPESPMSVAEVEAAVKAGEERGYFMNLAEVVEDLIAIAAPLPLKGRTLAVVMAGPMSRCYERHQEFGEFIRDAAARCAREYNSQ